MNEEARRSKVKSAVFRLKRNRREQLDCDETMFKTVVKTAFNQRRKTMRNSLRSLVNNDTEILRSTKQLRILSCLMYQMQVVPL